MKTEINKLRTPIAIVGMAKSGESALRLLIESGIARSSIITFDEKKSADITNKAELIQRSPQTVVVTPGFPLKSDLINDLKLKGCHITSELNLANSMITTEKIIGITGSLGKSTTVSLLGEAVRFDDPHAFIGGNLGIPFCDYVLNIKNGKPKAKWIVLELSSYQLENCHDLEFICTGLTYLSANHLERYDNIESYYLAKMNLLKQSNGKNFVNLNGGDSLEFLSKQSISFEPTNYSLFTALQYPYEQAQLIGQHNQDNLLLALTIAQNLCLSRAAQLKMLEYTGLSHRLELVGTFNSIRFINDSKATAIDSIITAVHATINNSNQLFLLLGGRDKNLPWEELRFLNNHQNIKAVFFGEAGKLIKEKTQLSGPDYSNLESAIDDCIKNATAGDCVLLSPGGTSLDEFKNFEDRGHFFKTKVRSHFADLLK